jgi:CCR4-NOT transcription complex subunit 1
MTSFPAAQNSTASHSTKSSAAGAQSVRGQPSAWGLPAPGTSARRVLTPLSTNLGSSVEISGPGRLHNTSSPSPFTPSFSSVLNSSVTSDQIQNPYPSSASTFFTPQSGSQQASTGHLFLSPRSRAITPSTNLQSTSSAAASTTASQGAGGGSSSGGGSSRTQPFSPSLQQHSLSSPISNTFERSLFPGSNSLSTGSGQASVSKIVVTQVFLLLGSITEKEGKAKWESQAEAIHKVGRSFRD